MPVDPELCRRKIRLILEDLARLRPIAQLDGDAYLAGDTNELVAERLLERIIGRMIDLNYHLAVELTGLPPSDYHASFLKLAELGVLAPDRARELAHASGLRDRLAHEYNGIDPRKVHDAARAAVAAVPEYLSAVESFLG